MNKNYDMSGIAPKVREILEDLDGRMPAEGMKKGVAVADAAAAPTQTEFNNLLKSLRDAGIIAK